MESPGACTLADRIGIVWSATPRNSRVSNLHSAGWPLVPAVNPRVIATAEPKGISPILPEATARSPRSNTSPEATSTLMRACPGLNGFSPPSGTLYLASYLRPLAPGSDASSITFSNRAGAVDPSGNRAVTSVLPSRLVSMPKSSLYTTVKASLPLDHVALLLFKAAVGGFWSSLARATKAVGNPL